MSMKYKVDGWNNFCRVFELPKKFSLEYCFGNGIPTFFVMVDWFYPVAGIPTPLISKEKWREEVGKIDSKSIGHDYLCKELIPFLLNKEYVKPERTYLVICDFGACFTFGQNKCL